MEDKDIEIRENQEQVLESKDKEEVVAEVPGELEQLQEELHKKEEEVKKNYDKYLRAMAEMENIKRRNTRDRDEYIKFATVPLIKKLLTVMDDMERAMEMCDPEKDDDAMVKGLKMISSKFKEIIQNEGVEEINAMGQPFDPQYHQPLMVEENSDYEENTVIEEMQKGYIMHGRVIRPSLVKVSGQS